MNKIAKQTVNSMNYFFLREVFQKNKLDKEISNKIETSRILEETSDSLYLRVLEEISTFLRFVSEEDLSQDMIDIISLELEEGNYMNDLSFDIVREMFEKTIQYILGYEDKILLDKYISIADDVYKRIK